ncbi:MAG: ATP-binding protein [Spirochaetales bacterium]|nr:ATP-binding protein [Spirochaetales bacterium]
MRIAFFILCFNAGIALIGAFIAWTKREMPAAVPLIFLKIAVIFWSVGYAFELISPDVDGKFFWTIVQYVGIISIPVPVFFLAFEHLTKKKLRTPIPVFLSLVIPVFIFIMLCTNGLHHLFYRKFELVVLENYNALDIHYGSVFWINVAYSYGFLILALILLIKALFALPSVYKRQTLLIICGFFIPWIANIVYIFRLFPFITIDTSPFGFSATGVIALFGLLYYNLFDFIPFAADTIINNMNDSIIILSKDNKLLKINPQAEKLLQCSSMDCSGKDISSLFNGNLMPLAGTSFKENTHIELHFSLDNETISYFDCKVSPVKKGKRLVAKTVILRDITLLKNAERSLKNWNTELEQRIIMRTRELSLANDHLKKEISKKELLLKEIHHRVKNNLAIIRSLIFVQSSSIKDVAVLNMFKDLTSRVASIGLIHEKLYKSEDFQTIDLDNYMSELVESHISTFGGKDSPITFEKDIDRISLNINTIIPLGLIFTELITNSIKYANDNKRECVLEIRAKKENNTVTIVVSDSGPGFPDSIIRGERKGTGLKVIDVLVNQLSGKIIFENDNGAKTTLMIPV